MKLKIIIFSGAFLFFTPLISIAQNSQSGSQQTIPVSAKARIGTYQFMITATKNTPVFTDEILFEIEQKRDETEIVYLDPAPGVRVMILPKKTIEAPGFIPLAEVVYY